MSKILKFTSTNQDFHFPGLSRTLCFNFQDFPGRGKTREKIQDFAGDVGTGLGHLSRKPTIRSLRLPSFHGTQIEYQL